MDDFNFINYYFFGTKGLNIRQINVNQYVIEDVFGVCSLPYEAENFSQLITQSYKIAKTIPLITKDDSLLFKGKLDSNYLYELEKYYVARLCDSYRIWQCGKSNYMTYDRLTRFIPLGYVECGYGESSKDTLEFVHQSTLNSINKDESLITKDLLNLHLKHLEIRRICSDIVALLQRAFYSFKNLLDYQRKTIKERLFAINLLNTNEIIHQGENTYYISTATTIAVISLCTSLDISTRLIDFVNNSTTPIKNFKPSQGKQFKDLSSIKGNMLSNDELSDIKKIWDEFPSIKSLIQFRHDLIHETTALEVEKIYIGIGTEEICSLPMHYCFQPWRDCDNNGQPFRYLGRKYFISKDINLEKQVCDWITDIIQGHLAVGKKLVDWMNNQIEKVDFNLDF